MAKLPQFSAECRVGRLVEARLAWLNDAGDVAVFQQTMNSAFARAGGAAVICADWRAVDVLPSQAGDALVALLRNGNRRAERSAVLLPATNAIVSLQVERLFREAGNPTSRRAFRQVEAQLAWLAEVLSPAELKSARSLLDR